MAKIYQDDPFGFELQLKFLKLIRFERVLNYMKVTVL